MNSTADESAETIDDLAALLSSWRPPISWGWSTRMDATDPELIVGSADGDWVRYAAAATDEDGEPLPGFQSCLYEVAERIDHTGYLHEYAGSEEYYETADDAAAALIGFATD